MWKIKSTQQSVVRKCTKLVINMGMTVMVQIIETINRLFGKLTRPKIQSARAMHRPLLAESFMEIHRPLLAESCEVMHRPPFKAKKRNLDQEAQLQQNASKESSPRECMSACKDQKQRSKVTKQRKSRYLPEWTITGQGEDQKQLRYHVITKLDDCQINKQDNYLQKSETQDFIQF